MIHGNAVLAGERKGGAEHPSACFVVGNRDLLAHAVARVSGQ
jgi:hypothetical protein